MNVIAAAAANGSNSVGSQRRARSGAPRSHALIIDIQLAARRRGVPHAASLRRWAQAAYQAAVERKPAAAPAVTIRIIDSTESRRLNRTWRAKDKPTNVLSFPSMADSKPASREIVELIRPAAYRLQPAAWIDRSSIHLGDIAICAPVVAREAREQHKAPQAHWAHMVVHGVLHLLGYDHENDRDAKVMEARETKLLMQLGYSDPYRTYV